MPTILSDHDIEGHVDVLLSIWLSADWSELWNGLDCRVEYFESLKLPHSLPDSELWKLCQERQFVLITGNRNEDSDDSLESVSKRLNQANSLPILTFANSQRVIADRRYAVSVADAVLSFLMDLDRIRGTRRLYVP